MNIKRLISCFLLLIVFPGTIYANNSIKVLILNSWSPDHFWVKGEVKGIEDALRQRHNKIEFTTEYMAHPRTKGKGQERYIESFHQFFNTKYIEKKDKFDIIFVTDDPAFDYMIKYHDLYFPNTPVVFCGINNYKPEKIKNKKQFFGILEEVDYLGTLSIAHKLHPKAKKFYFIGDQTSTSQSQISEIKKISSTFPVEFIYLDNLTFDELAEKLRNLTTEDIVFNLAFYSDSTGKQISLEETLYFLENNVSVPVYSFWKWLLGKGTIIGGKVLSSYEHGKNAVEIFYTRDEAKKFLVQGGDTPYIFDYNQLVRFGIGLHKVPSKAQIINKPFSFYETYKLLVNGTIAFIALLLVFLIILLLNIKKRKLVEKDLRKTRKKLEVFNRVLEAKVHKRTAELEESNNELEETIYNLKNTQSKLVEVEKMASLGSLVAGVAHEINTPVGIGLTASSHLSYLTEVLKEKYEEDEMSENEFEKYLKEADDLSTLIFSNLDRTSNIIKNFKQVAVDQTSEQKRVFNLKEYTNGILYSIDNIIKKKDIKIEILCDKNINVNSYPGQYSQIITSLIINSVKHGFRLKESGLISISILIEKSTINIIYKDNGSGIPKEVLPKIFDPFFTTNREDGGSGLGLNIIYNIVTSNLNGSITCESEEDEGTTFKIYIPLLD